MTSLCAVCITAGGQSRRMGSDKAQLDVAGQPMIRRVVDALGVLAPISIIGGDVSLLDLLPERADVTHWVDTYPGEGPLGALITALDAVQNAYATTDGLLLLVACDVINFDAQTARYLVAEHVATCAEVTVPLVGGYPQWHVSVWNVGLLSALRERFLAGERSLRGIARELQTTFAVTSESSRYIDLDTPQDLAAFVARP